MQASLDARARELMAQGYTPLRTMRRLRQEFPLAERFDLHTAVGLGPTGTFSLWAELGSPLRPVISSVKPRRVIGA